MIMKPLRRFSGMHPPTTQRRESMCDNQYHRLNIFYSVTLLLITQTMDITAMRQLSTFIQSVVVEYGCTIFIPDQATIQELITNYLTSCLIIKATYNLYK